MAMSRSPGATSFTQPVADEDFAAGDFFEAGDHAQRRRLAAAGRADQHHELAVGDLERDVAHGVEAVGVFLVEMSKETLAMGKVETSELRVAN